LMCSLRKNSNIENLQHHDSFDVGTQLTPQAVTGRCSATLNAG